MRMRTYLISLILFLLTLSLHAHKGGHGYRNTKEWSIDGNKIEASFLAFKDGLVFLETKTGELVIEELSAFTRHDRLLIEDKINRIKSINQVSGNSGIFVAKHERGLENNGFSMNYFLIALSAVSFFIFAYFFRRKRMLTASMSVASFLIIMVFACGNSDDSGDTDDGAEDDDPIVSSVPANDVDALQELFGLFSNVTTDFDDTYFYVSSTGLPDHDMMVGITNWQQQVPIPQDYTGGNSWAFPIQPVLAETPLSSSEHFLRGAIAIAVNGIPVFNPLNNRGEDALAIGELDQWGGHCGRADDYHYHVPPTHLEATVGADQPVAYALDGFPVYGETTEELDEYLGKFNEDGSYQYHTTDTAPYFIAGMRGQITLDPNTTAPEDQILPQAMTREVRPALTPLAGAVITGFNQIDTNAYSLEYQIGTDTYYTNYSWDENGLYTYEYVDADGTVTTATYQR
ncbi:YHYH protein [Ulvibacterium sp.]|uniref:YHYH protein n=1 Tax=Ulvibacterium sp. TaxID=2665914 RepID=UPI003BA985C2